MSAAPFSRNIAIAAAFIVFLLVSHCEGGQKYIGTGRMTSRPTQNRVDDLDYCSAILTKKGALESTLTFA
jgi:hypothetical protein